MVRAYLGAACQPYRHFRLHCTHDCAYACKYSSKSCGDKPSLTIDQELEKHLKEPVAPTGRDDRTTPRDSVMLAI